MGDSTMQVTLRAPREAMEAMAGRLVADPAAVLSLGDGLAHGVMLAARRVPHRLRRNALNDVKATAAAVYLLATTLRRDASPAVVAAIEHAERTCAAACPSAWRAASPSARAGLLAAYLVHRTAAWGRLRLRDPFQSPESAAEHFYKRYIGPGLSDVRASLQGAAARSAFLHGLDPRIHSVLLPPQ